jgi:predicted nucleotidyltransferase
VAHTRTKTAEISSLKIHHGPEEDLFGRRVELVTSDSLSPYIASYVEKDVMWAD